MHKLKKEVYEVTYHLKHGYKVSEIVESIHEAGGIKGLNNDDYFDMIIIENNEGTHVFNESDVVYRSYKSIPYI